jgi:hypothetical protein
MDVNPMIEILTGQGELMEPGGLSPARVQTEAYLNYVASDSEGYFERWQARGREMGVSEVLHHFFWMAVNGQRRTREAVMKKRV